MRADYLKLRDRILQGLQAIPGSPALCRKARFMCIRTCRLSWGNRAEEAPPNWPRACCTEAHVVTVPGEAFGTQEHIRLSYAVAHHDIDEGMAG